MSKIDPAGCSDPEHARLEERLREAERCGLLGLWERIRAAEERAYFWETTAAAHYTVIEGTLKILGESGVDVEAAAERMRDRAEKAEARAVALRAELTEMQRNHPEAACYGPTGPYPKLQARAAALERAAREVVNEYRSHGGKGTHQTCVPGCGCLLPKVVDVLEAALDADGGGEKQ